MKTNTTITSSLESKDDVDWYVYEVNDSTGVEWIEFKALCPQGIFVLSKKKILILNSYKNERTDYKSSRN